MSVPDSYYDPAERGVRRMEEFIDIWYEEGEIDLGDRVFAKPYDCWGTVVEIKCRDELKLKPGFSFPKRLSYYVKLDGKDLKPRGFSHSCLEKLSQ